MAVKQGKLTKSRLGILLSRLEGFIEPKVRDEQYTVDPEIAAEILWNSMLFGEIEGKVSVDLGCGTGILGLGMLVLGAKKVILVDNDEKAIKIAKNNYKKLKSGGLIAGKALFKCCDISKFSGKYDLVIQNPPFGTKVKHHDKVFLEKAIKISKVVYSFHKSETSGFVRAFCKDNGFNITHKWDFSWPLKQTLKFHRKRIYRVKVSCFRLENIKNKKVYK